MKRRLPTIEPQEWRKRFEKAERAIERVRLVPDDQDAQEIVIAAASDPMWEVRKMVAMKVWRLTEDIYQRVIQPLSEDRNGLVRRSALRSQARRYPEYQPTTGKPGVLQRALNRFETQYGPEARRDAFKIADKSVQLHLRNAVHDLNSILGYFREDQRNQKLTRRGFAFLRRLADMMDRYSEELDIVRRPEVIAPIVEEAISSAVDQVNAQGRDASCIEIQRTIEIELIASISRYHMSMALTNLIKNAIEAHVAPNGELRPGRVTVCANRMRGVLCVTVADTGNGMEPDDLLDLMQYIPGISSKGKRGSGFGVPIAYRYIEGHGGSLHFDSTFEKGTMATVRIPDETQPIS